MVRDDPVRLTSTKGGSVLGEGHEMEYRRPTHTPLGVHPCGGIAEEVGGCVCAEGQDSVGRA